MAQFETEKVVKIALTSEKYPELKQAYDLVQALKKWYDTSRCRLSKLQIRNDLYDWYKVVKNSEIEAFKSFVKMLRKHEI